MPEITVKYEHGQCVACHGIEGMITAIFIRGKNTCYEFSYVDSDGNPRGVNLDECELTSSDIHKMGFVNGKDS